MSNEYRFIIDALRGRLFDIIRDSELYQKYNGATIVSGEYTKENFELLVRGLYESGKGDLLVEESIQDWTKKQEKCVLVGIKEMPDFDASKGIFLQFESQESKDMELLRITSFINALKNLKIFFKNK